MIGNVAVVPGGYSPGLVNLVKSGTETLTIPTNHIYILNWATVIYKCSADVGARTFRLIVDILSAGDDWLVLCGTGAVASDVKRVQWGIAKAGVNVDDGVDGKPLSLPQGCVIKCDVSGGFAGDTWNVYMHYWDILAQR